MHMEEVQAVTVEKVWLLLEVAGSGYPAAGIGRSDGARSGDGGDHASGGGGFSGGSGEKNPNVVGQNGGAGAGDGRRWLLYRTR